MATPSVTSAYQQVAEWVQGWKAVNMAKPLTPVNGSDASNDGIQKPQGEQPGVQAGPAAGTGRANGIDTYA